MALTEEKKAELKAAHPNGLRVVTHGDDVLVMRGPNRGEYKRFIDRVSNDSTKGQGLEELARSCMVYPPRDQHDELADRKPALFTQAASAALEIAGADEKAEIEKL